MLKIVAIAGPGNSISPAVSTSSCQTPVRNSTPLSSIAPKPAKNRIDAPVASAKRRFRSSSGSMTGAGCRCERRHSAGRSTSGRSQQREHRCRGPSPIVPLDDRHDQRPHSDDQHRRAHNVRPRGVLLAMLAQGAQARHQRGDADGHVDEEHQAPVGLDQQPSKRRSGRRRDPAARRPQPDRDVPLLGLELRQHQTQRGRQHQRAAGRLHDPRGDQRLHGRRRGTGRAGHDEHAEAQQERALAAERVGPAPGRYEQRGEHDRIGAQHPRQRARARRRRSAWRSTGRRC